MPASIFSETELARLASFPEDIPGDDLIRAFTLTGADRDRVAIRRGQQTAWGSRFSFVHFATSASRCSGHGTWKNSKLGLSNGPLSTMLRRFSFASLVSGCAPRGSSFQHPTESYDLSVRRAVAHRRERTPWSSLKWLGQGASGESPGSIKSEVAKLTFLRQLGAHEWDLSDLNPNRRKFLAQVGRRSTSQTLQRMPDRRRYPHPRGLPSRDHA